MKHAKDSALCRSVGKDLNRDFGRRWWYAEALTVLKSGLLKVPDNHAKELDLGHSFEVKYRIPLLSLAPPSKRLNNIVWTLGSFARDGREFKDPLIYTSVDMDNDGTPDLVVKFLFSTGHTAGDSPNHISVFSPTEADLRSISVDQLFRGADELHEPRSLEEAMGREIRIFERNNQVFILSYVPEYTPISYPIDLVKEYPLREHMQVLRIDGSTTQEDEYRHLIPKTTIICDYLIRRSWLP